MRILPVLVFGLSAACLPAHDVTHITVAGRDVAVWKPGGPAPPSGYPVIVFSHGFMGCNTQSVFLTEALAASGYLVVAPNHARRAVRDGAAERWRPVAAATAPRRVVRRRDVVE